jgi:propionyl-CoA synthetase
VAECAVVGVADADKGQVPLGLVVLKDGQNTEAATLRAELVASIRAEVGAFANFRRVLTLERLPKTRSGKILRQIIRKIVDGEQFTVPSTIDDPVIVDEIRASLAQEQR